ncbi:MAG: hypothetical protein RLZZ111_474 [Planctomycetota bacterium]|jgi:uncharacterized membrane protein YozB (DUF420 family)
MSLAEAAVWLPTLNAALNTLATLLLVAGWVLIRRGRWRAHRAAMVAAFAVSAVFLVSYLTYHAIVGHVPFTGQGAVRPVYFAILLTHIVLAAAVPLLAIAMFVLALRGRWEAHRRLGRITMPIWLYVSVTGVVIYLMLYHFYPGRPAEPKIGVAAVGDAG